MTDALDRLASALSDRYTIEREIGRGGMAVVYLAQDLKHDRKVALKVMRPELSAILGGERFLREVSIAAKLNHPHILALHDSGQAEEFLYYVMPHVEGESLRSKIEREKQLSIDNALGLTRQVASALDYAHQQGVIHRDIKPENILLHRGEAMVADFGIALAVTAAGGERLTETGLSLGTPEYMSPEQATGEKEVDARSDIYSLAAVLYEMVTGEPPQTGATVQVVIAKLLSERPTQPRVVRDSVPEVMDRAIMKALAKVPADRFDSAGEFVAALSADVAEPEVEKKSIVVLPFENLSPDPDNEYFSDGLTEEIITDLSKIPALRVISRTSAMQFKRTDKNTRAIGRELNVRYVLEGSVRRAGKRLRITAQLIDATNDSHLWADRYDGTLEDVFEFQEQMASAIADELREKLGLGSERLVVEKPLGDPQAYDYFLRARQLIHRWDPEDARVALGLLKEALEIEGDNVLIYAGMGEAYFCLSHGRGDELKGYMDKVQECAEKIFELDPGSSHGHTLTAHVNYTDQRFSECFASAKRALEINPNDAGLLWFFTFMSSQWGQLEIAEACARRFLEIDPLNPFSSFIQGIYWMLGEGRYDLAVEPLHRAHRMSPRSGIFAFKYARALASVGRIDDACAALDHVNDHTDDAFMGLGPVFKSALQADKAKTLEALTPDIKATALLDETTSWHLATVYSLIGKAEDAVLCLSRAVELGFFNYPVLAERDPLLEGIRNEPSFLELMEKTKRIWEVFPEHLEAPGLIRAQK